MVPGFELLFDCNKRLPEPKKEDTNWVPIDWADYMDPDAMTILLGEAICNIEEEEYWEACQHALKSLYEAEQVMKMRNWEKPLVIVKVTIVETTIANVVAMFGVNPLLIEKMMM